jgi:hypothetical protein
MNGQNLRTIKNIYIFLNFANFYRRFILRYSKVIKLLTDLLKEIIKNRKSNPFYFTKEVRTAFKKLKEYFKLAPIFRLYDSKFSIRFETDISNFVIKIIISQLFPIKNNKRKK